MPRLTTKMVEKEIREWEKKRSTSRKEGKEKEAEVKRKIHEIRKDKMKNRKHEEKDTLPQKKRKLDESQSVSQYISVIPDMRKAEKMLKK